MTPPAEQRDVVSYAEHGEFTLEPDRPLGIVELAVAGHDALPGIAIPGGDSHVNVSCGVEHVNYVCGFGSPANGICGLQNGVCGDLVDAYCGGTTNFVCG
jgi:hypothetical protein